MKEIGRLNLTSDPLRILIEQFMNVSLFSVCSVALLDKEDVYTVSFRRSKLEGIIVEYKDEYVFDLASLTKPLVVSISLLALIDENLLNISETVKSIYPEASEVYNLVKITDLLNHTSGLPAHRDYWQDIIHLPVVERYNALIEMILHEKFIAKPNTSHMYSDLGFILLGDIIEKRTKLSLNEYWHSKISGFIPLKDSLFYPTSQSTCRYISTGYCKWSGIKLSGIVHDDNCRAIGGVAGHAGLFGSAYGVSLMVLSILRGYFAENCTDNFIDKKIRIFLNDGSGPHYFGFDSPSESRSSSGRFFSRISRGHLGFTGTSFWMDFDKSVGVVVLTDAVACGEQRSVLRAFRSATHDVLMKHICGYR